MRSLTRSLVGLCLFSCVLIMLVSCSGGSEEVVGVPTAETEVIDDLVAIDGSSSTVTLQWTSPALAEKADLAITYELRLTPLANANFPWQEWDIATAPPGDRDAGVTRRYVVTGLQANETYAFVLRARSGGGAFSIASNLALAAAAPEFDVIPPARISDLQQWAGTATSVTMAWTAALDDSVIGDVASHELRYSTEPITVDNWADATVVSGSPVAAEIEGMVELTAEGLSEDTLYYWAVVATDNHGLTSRLSNVPAVTVRRLNVIRIYVDGSGDYPTIERALGAAQPGDLVLVGPGRYLRSVQGTGEPLRPMITVGRGKTDFEMRSMAGAARTIIDGERMGSIMGIIGGELSEPGAADTDYAGITIDGFTFVNGVANGVQSDPNESWAGAALVFHLTDSIVRNCIFRDNEASEGGAVWVGGQGDATIEDCLIENNKAIVGGGVVLVNSDELVNVRRCTIRNNRATWQGGGVLVYNSRLVMNDCLIVGNTAGDDGGGLAIMEEPTGVDITGSTIADNEAGGMGGGIYVVDMVSRISRSIVAANTGGGGIKGVRGGILEIGCSIVQGNTGGNTLPTGSLDLGNLLSLDPMFCDLVDFELNWASPAFAENRSGGDDCGMIGAVGAGCADR